MSAAVNVFVRLAIANGVCGVTFACVAATASPATPVQVRPSARITVAATPGMTIDFRAASSARWSVAAVAGSTGSPTDDGAVAIGDPVGDGSAEAPEPADDAPGPPLGRGDPGSAGVTPGTAAALGGADATEPAPLTSPV